MYTCIKTFRSINGTEYIKGMEIFFGEYSDLGYGEQKNFVLSETLETITA
jgi:hypothetical protein